MFTERARQMKVPSVTFGVERSVPICRETNARCAERRHSPGDRGQSATDLLGYPFWDGVDVSTSGRGAS
jgi:hypothetical protein